MGTSASKPRASESDSDECLEDEYFIKSPTGSERDIKEVEKLRKEYRDKPETFLLNQVLFSVMFFQNYEQELADATPNEANISVEQLSFTDDLFLTCLRPDDALSLVNKHVKFCATHGLNKDKESPLVSNRIFVIYENIQVVAEENHYAQIDRPSLTAQIVEKHRKGYVRLKYIEDLKFKNSVSSNSSTLTNSDSSSVDDRSETYGRITEARTIKPMPKMDPDKLKRTLFPISEVKRKNKYAEDDNDLFITEYFVNSKSMKDKFLGNWPNIAKVLKLTDKETETGFNCDSIFCLSKTCGTLFEIIPAVQLPKGAYEYFMKIKSANIDMQLAQNVDRVFPNKAMLREIVHMDRLAIPRGFIPKYKDELNPDCHLEWELAHPKVEKYLQQLLTHTHIRTLLLMALILKSYVEPKSTTQGVTLRHLVIHLFWELQNDVVINETRMGTRVVKMLDAFCRRLSKSCLPDYFVEERNHFENIPSHHLRDALVQFSRTRDQPLQNFMAAIRNLQYKHEGFPPLNVQQLHDLLTKSMAPGGRKPMQPRQTRLDWEGQVRAKLMRQRQSVNVENLKPERKVSVDSILESTMHIEPTEHVEQLNRSWKILAFFLEHYINMAISLHSLGNLKQALSYLRQGELITYLFHKSQESDARKYQKKISELRKSLQEQPPGDPRGGLVVRQTTSNGPTLPERTPSVYIPAMRVINQNTMDMNKVLQNHQNGEVKPKVIRRRRESEITTRSDSDSDSDHSASDSDAPVEEVRLKQTSSPQEERPKRSVMFIARHDSDTSEQARPRTTKSVNFSSEVIVGKDPNVIQPKVQPQVEPTDRVENRVNSASSDSDSVLSQLEDEEEEDLDGLDEIMTDDDDAARQTVIQFTNPYDPHSNKINLGFEPDDTFT